MNAAIDIGNTFIKVGIFEQNTLVDFETSLKSDVSRINAFIEKFTIENTMICSVAENIDELKINTNKLGHIYNFTFTSNIPIINVYKTPETLGMDRLAAAIGGWYLNKNSSVLTIDAGTCITYDCVNESKEYIGGAISPGLYMRLKAMHEFTQKLPSIHFIEFTDVLGKNTVESMSSGSLQGVKNEIEGYISYFNKMTLSNLQVYITGGDATFLVDQLKSSNFANQIILEPNLVLKGLNNILQYQTKHI
jgi:type III pantothenate kinase